MAVTVYIAMQSRAKIYFFCMNMIIALSISDQLWNGGVHKAKYSMFLEWSMLNNISSMSEIYSN